MTTITLKRPVANGPEIVKSFTWRPIKLGDYPTIMKAVSSLSEGRLGEFSDDLLGLVSHFSGQPRAVVNEIDEVDGQSVLDSLAAHLAQHMSKVAK